MARQLNRPAVEEGNPPAPPPVATKKQSLSPAFSTGVALGPSLDIPPGEFGRPDLGFEPRPSAGPNGGTMMTLTSRIVVGPSSYGPGRVEVARIHVEQVAHIESSRKNGRMTETVARGVRIDLGNVGTI